MGWASYIYIFSGHRGFQWGEYRVTSCRPCDFIPECKYAMWAEKTQLVHSPNHSGRFTYALHVNHSEWGGLAILMFSETKVVSSGTNTE